jgi:riboflavin biosynthesis pyrimidine reductase
VADVILVAAGTVRAEGYGPPRTPADRRAQREAAGQAPFPRLAVISRTLDLDPGAPLFAEAPEPPLVFTGADAPPHRHRALAPVAEVVVARSPSVDVADVVADLGARGARVVLCEGGPSLNGQLLAADLVDEVNLTLAAQVVGGAAARLATGAPADDRALVLAHLWERDGDLFARYLRAPG